MRIVITGIAGGLGRLITERLLANKHEIYGIDRRPWPDCPPEIQILKGDVRKRPAEDVFRTWKPDVLIHTATVTHVTAKIEERVRINLGGTRRLFNHCVKYNVKQMIFVGRHTVYGAAADSPLYHSEDDPPLGGSTFPELADLVAADLYAASALWRWPKLKTAVLRVVYTLGPSRRGTLASFLSGQRVPAVLGFDPLFQFIHEFDAAQAIVEAVEKQIKGVFNVTGPMPIPLSVLCRATGRSKISVPQHLFEHVLGRFGFPKLPRGAAKHIKYPIIIDGTRFKNATGFTPRYDEGATMDGYRWLN